MSPEDGASLANEIKNAFADVVRPDGDKLADCSCDECRFVLRGLAGRDWRDLRQDDLGDSTNEAIMTLSASAFRYYLPGLMLLALRGEEGTEMLPYDLLGRFSFSAQEQGERVQQAIAALNAAQRAVIARFLRFMQQQDVCLCPAVTASAIANLESDQLRPYSQADVDAWVRQRLA